MQGYGQLYLRLMMKETAGVLALEGGGRENL
jgi:hypothetical protein